ncbi:hypothetical protein VNO78_25222 [Psophocarpus tetragonolobus]|uniref:WRC domain-containing protein n=1 Tax=Psophocarpus tetragonolobus TaxID=3891 RepID=A0AAN9XF46_PSOTE
MRIRKNAKLSPLLFSSSSCVQGGSVPVESHVCQLNQSPWDVIPFDSDSIQFQLDDPFTPENYNNGSTGDSSVQSIASMMDTDRMTSRMLVDDKMLAPIFIEATASSRQSWPCKNEATQGQSFCDQHLSFSQPTPLNKKSHAQAHPTGPVGPRRAKTRGAGKKPPPGASSNPYEFYYYSGFGPLWGKRRGDRNGGEGTKNAFGVQNSTMMDSDNVSPAAAAAHDDNIHDNNVAGAGVVPSASEMNNEGIIDYVDDDEEEEEAEDDSGKKRMRKPVKARSLKSLM